MPAANGHSNSRDGINVVNGKALGDSRIKEKAKAQTDL